MGLVARVADNISTLRKALDDANFTGGAVREAGKGGWVLACIVSGHTATEASRSRLNDETASHAINIGNTHF